jgi:hypothetical protein
MLSLMMQVLKLFLTPLIWADLHCLYYYFLSRVFINGLLTCQIKLCITVTKFFMQNHLKHMGQLQKYSSTVYIFVFK